MSHWNENVLDLVLASAVGIRVAPVAARATFSFPQFIKGVEIVELDVVLFSSGQEAVEEAPLIFQAGDSLASSWAIRWPSGLTDDDTLVWVILLPFEIVLDYIVHCLVN